MARRARIVLALAAAGAWLVLARGAACAQWAPPGLQPARAALAEVLAANAKATGAAEPAFAQRRERWTYAHGALRLPVEVTVKGADFRAEVALGGARYAAGRARGVRWRADANGVAHATLSDLQGDALDRLPQSPFGWSAADCALAGETRGPHPAWAVVDRAPRDKPHWFFVDEASGLIVREITREGGRTVVTAFDRFEPLGGALRPRHWRVSDGGRRNDLDVTVDAVEPGVVADAALATPAPHEVFAPPARAADAAPAADAVTLPARFSGDGRIVVEVELGAGRRAPFVLDTGTASISLDDGLAGKLGLRPALEHAIVPRMTVGGLAARDVSALAIPLRGLSGILGYDFFFGHVVRVDYANRRVEVIPHARADALFADPRTTVVPANVGEGLPLVAASLGAARGERFAVDTGSDRLVALDPFERRYASDIASWKPVGPADGSPSATFDYLEGSIRVGERTAPELDFAAQRFDKPVVAVQGRNTAADALDPPFDGIIGTDVLSLFDCWFDYDGGRIGLRRYTAVAPAVLR